MSAGSGPLRGVRVLEAAGSRPGRIAGMILADLGADVVRVLYSGASDDSLSPEAVCWDRGKRLRPMASTDVISAAARADVMIVDAGPTALATMGCDSTTIRRLHPSLIHVWMPPYSEHGEWKDVPEDPLLLAALCGLAVYYPADDESPIAPVVPCLTYLHGALGASAAVAALVGRARQGVTQPSIVTGLHAAGALLSPLYAEFDDAPALSPSRALKWTPNWRAYRCADDRWIFLAAITPEMFLRALEVLDRLHVMALPSVEGDFYSILDLNRGRLAVTAELEPVFAAEPSAVWLERLQQARVPCAIIQDRHSWLDGPIVRENGGRVDLPHPTLGTVTMPNVPITFADTPAGVRGFAVPEPSDDLWPTGPAEPAVTAAPMPDRVDRLPLDGLRVVDASTYQAGPGAATILADFGAQVVHVERKEGDPFRNYELSFLAINQRKDGIVLDLKQPHDLDRIRTLLAPADVLVENLRPRMRADIMVTEAEFDQRFPNLVHCSVSAFGEAEAFADLPGFDPVLQALNGMALAQGGGSQPIICTAPFNDTLTAALGALGILSALYHRQSSGRGQRLWVSLAASSTFAQAAEYTTWSGAPEPITGDLMFRGPDPGHHYYECQDGWVAVAADGEPGMAQLMSALGIGSPIMIEAALSAHTVGSATKLLGEAGVPACRVVPRLFPLRDRFLVDNDFTHYVTMPVGVARIVDHVSRWPAAPEPRRSRFFEPGADEEKVWSELNGLDQAHT